MLGYASAYRQIFNLQSTNNYSLTISKNTLSAAKAENIPNPLTTLDGGAVRSLESRSGLLNDQRTLGSSDRPWLCVFPNSQRLFQLY